MRLWVLLVLVLTPELETVAASSAVAATLRPNLADDESPIHRTLLAISHALRARDNTTEPEDGEKKKPQDDMVDSMSESWNNTTVALEKVFKMMIIAGVAVSCLIYFLVSLQRWLSTKLSHARSWLNDKTDFKGNLMDASLSAFISYMRTDSKEAKLNKETYVNPKDAKAKKIDIVRSLTVEDIFKLLSGGGDQITPTSLKAYYQNRCKSYKRNALHEDFFENVNVASLKTMLRESYVVFTEKCLGQVPPRFDKTVNGLRKYLGLSKQSTISPEEAAAKHIVITQKGLLFKKDKTVTEVFEDLSDGSPYITAASLKKHYLKLCSEPQLKALLDDVTDDDLADMLFDTSMAYHDACEYDIAWYKKGINGFKALLFMVLFLVLHIIVGTIWGLIFAILVTSCAIMFLLGVVGTLALPALAKAVNDFLAKLRDFDIEEELKKALMPYLEKAKAMLREEAEKLMKEFQKRMEEHQQKYEDQANNQDHPDYPDNSGDYDGGYPSRAHRQ
jgi:hypothetical protein